jgi:hypothetical protein
MRIRRLQRAVLFLLSVTTSVWSLSLGGEVRQYRLGPLSRSQNSATSDVLVALSDGAVDFEVEDQDAAAVQIQIRTADNTLVFDSGVQRTSWVRWDLNTLDPQAGRRLYPYTITIWNADNQVIGSKLGELSLPDSAPPVSLAYNQPGNFTVGGYLGVGTDTPQRAVHLVGPNAVFRMDRSADTAAFLLVRTDIFGNPLKTFVVGANAAGPNDGEFIINDIGAAVGGGGQRRMTITNAGDTIFGGNVTATAYYTTSSIRFKENVRRLEDPIGKLEQLRGVRFDWKVSGAGSVGVIAEEVAKVLPEAVSWDSGRKNAVGVNYDSLVALLIETSKAQQTDIENLTTEVDELTAQVQSELKRTEILLAAWGKKD